MSQSRSEGDDSDRGCLLVIGIVIVSLCVGHIYTQVAGWLTLGIFLVIWAILSGPRR